ESQFQTEERVAVEQTIFSACREQLVYGIRSFRLQVQVQRMSLRKSTQLLLVAVRQRREMAKDQGAIRPAGNAVADGNFDLWNLARCLQALYQLCQSRQQGGHTRMQDFTAVHVGNEVAVTLAEAHQHALLLADMASGKARLAPVAAGTAADD